jgi:hypothetical protein
VHFPSNLSSSTGSHIVFYASDKLKRTEGAIIEYRNQIDTRRPENYGFASMAAVPYAHIVANFLRHKHPKGTDITLAPNPKDIVSAYEFVFHGEWLTLMVGYCKIWENVTKSDGEIARRKILGFLWLALVCFFNTLPLAIISALANLNSVSPSFIICLGSDRV